jgi:hypothetical protein
MPPNPHTILRKYITVGLLFVVILGLVPFLGNYQSRGKKHIESCLAAKPFQTNVDVSVNFLEPSYNYSRSTKNLTQAASSIVDTWANQNGYRGRFSSAHANIPGVTINEWFINYNFKKTVIKPRFMLFGQCLYAKELTVQLQHKDHIYIGSDVAQNSCMKNIVAKHEWKHHIVNKKTIQHYANLMKADMKVFLARLESQRNASSVNEDTEKRMSSEVKKAIDTYTNGIEKELAYWNNKVDSPQEYGNLSLLLRQCSNAQQ